MPSTLQTTMATTPCVERRPTGAGIVPAPADDEEEREAEDNATEPVELGLVAAAAVVVLAELPVAYATELVAAQGAEDEGGVEPAGGSTAVAAALVVVPKVEVVVACKLSLLLANDAVVAVTGWSSCMRTEVEGHRVHWYVVGGHPGSFRPEYPMLFVYPTIIVSHPASYIPLYT